jgi:exopolysaccharide biosynthesis protein
MSAKEVTEFLVEYFNPRHALNMDGGGSTTMYIKGSGESLTDVINYPTDNRRYDHYGQRRVSSHILVKRKK